MAVENNLLTKYLSRLGFDREKLMNYDGVLLIPVNRCSSCVSAASHFTAEKKDILQNVLFILTTINSTKELKIRYRLDDSKSNVVFDTENYFTNSKLDFGNVGYYLFNDSGDIHLKEVMNPNNINQKLIDFENMLIAKQ